MGNNSSLTIRNDEIDDIVRETEFTRPQIIRLHNRFLTLDQTASHASELPVNDTKLHVIFVQTQDFVLAKGKGYLNRDDLRSVPELGVNPLRERIVDTFFTMAGRNVKQLNYRQFVSVLAYFQPIDETKKNSLNGRKQKLKFAFQMYDLNKNGYITREEFKTILKSMVGADSTAEQLEKIADLTLEETDNDNDGKISFDDFCRSMEKTDIEEKMSIRFLN